MKIFAAICTVLGTAILAQGSPFFLQRDLAFHLPDSLLGRTVFEGYPSSPALGYFVRPWFEAAHGVWLEKGMDGFTVFSTRMKRPLYYTGAEWPTFSQQQKDELVEQVKEAKLVESFKRDLGKALGERVVLEWQRTLTESRVGKPGLETDGAAIIFSSFVEGKGGISRDAKSPPPGTPAGKLRAIGEALCAFARNGEVGPIEAALSLPAKESTEKPGSIDD
jgi:hypothetical protein